MYMSHVLGNAGGWTHGCLIAAAPQVGHLHGMPSGVGCIQLAAAQAMLFSANGWSCLLSF
jgi:hypothetical protein